jgi:predicted permease
LRSLLVTLEIAFSMVLLTAAGLLLRSLWNLESVPLGIETDHVVTARFVLGRQRYGGAQQQLAFFNELERRAAAAPGVEAAAITDSLPPSGGMRGRPFSTIEIDGKPRLPEGTGGMVAWRYVTPEYFDVLGIPIVRGRRFTERDQDDSAFTVILSESLARRMFPHEDAIGQRILKGPQGQWATVIGIARDVTNLGATRESWPEFYIPRKHAVDFNFQNQEPPTGWRSAVIVARTAVDPTIAASSLRVVLASMEPSLPVEMETMRQRVRQIDQRPRFYATLLAVFAGMGVLIASVGLFGVMSFLVAQRTREIGVRMALGATPAGIVRMTLASAGRWTLAGVALGAGASFLAARVLQSLLFQVKPGDPVTAAAAVAILCLVSLAATAGPARRAAHLDPNRTLRQE